jgi:hypothetical protein
MDLFTRAELALVLEDVKPGVITGGNWSSFQRILQETGLIYLPTSRKYSLDLAAMVARPEAMQEYMTQMLQVPERAKGDIYHRIYGKFLGYPSCCTDEYLRPRTREEIAAKRNGHSRRSYRFGREIHELLTQTGTYPDVFDYCTPAFTPCTVECPNALETLAKWKEALDRCDPEAGEALADFNKRQR